LPEQFFWGYTPFTAGNQIYLERPTIDQLLEKAVQNPVVSVVAGAGYGKTNAVYSFVRKYNVRTAWIQCSEWDNVPVRFWENFISAVTIISRETAEKLRQLEFPSTEQKFESYSKIHRNDIFPTEKYFFVYDDIHLITNKTVLRFLEHSITISSPYVTSILISRFEPTLNLAKQEAKNLLARITENELRFSQNEMIAYLKLQNINPAPHTASAIYHDTEGWAFAISLAGLSLRNVPAGSAYVPQALRSNMFKLIESEIMAGLSPRLQRLLIKLSLIENINPDLLGEIGGDTSMISEMEGIGSFIRFDSLLNSYRIHHLFMDYLRGRQGELSEEEKKDVWTKAAIWCAANNHMMDALVNCEKTGDYDGIVKILNALPLLLPTQMARFIFDLLNRAPKSIYRDHPETIELRTRVLNSLGLLEQSQRETLEMLPGLRELPENSLKHRALMSSYLNLGFIGLILAPYTKQFDFTGDFREAAAESRLANHAITPPSNGITMSSYACRVLASAPKEDIENYIAVIGEIVPYSVEAMGGCQYGMYELARGEYAFFRGQVQEAEKILLASLAMAREKQQYEIENRSLFYLLRIYLSRGNSTELEKVLVKLKEQLEEPLYKNRYFYNDIVAGWYYIQTGQRDKLSPWLKSDYEESDLNSIAQGLEKLVKAKYYFSEKRYPAALAAMENRGGAEPLLFGEIEMKALEAVCHYRLQNRDAAFAALNDAYTLAAPAGLFMPFTELGKDMRSLTDAAIKDETTETGRPPEEWLLEIRRSASIYAKKLYRRIEEAAPGPAHKEGRRLSHREMEVLLGLSRGLTREEIADAGSISPNTVKSVTRSIYNKLGALNQADAVRIATEQGLLSREEEHNA